MIKAAPGSERLKSFAERINRLLDEKQGIGADIGDIYTEAKSVGYVPKVLRKAIARQRMEPAKRQEEDSILELYEAALDGPTREAVKLAAQGASARQIEAATGIDQATVARSVSLKKKRETHKSTAGPEQDAATIRPSSDDAPQAERTDEPPATPVPDGGVGAGSSLPSSAPVAASEKEVLGANTDLGVAAGAGPLDVQETTNGREDEGKDRDAAGDNRGHAEQRPAVGDILPGRPAGDIKGDCRVGQAVESASLPGPHSREVVGVDTRPEGTSIDLTIPEFLRRTA